MNSSSIQERLLESIDTYLYAESRGTSSKGCFLNDGSFRPLTTLSFKERTLSKASLTEVATSIQTAFDSAYVQSSFEKNGKHSNLAIDSDIKTLKKLKKNFENKGQKHAAQILEKTIHTLAQGILVEEEKIANLNPKNAVESFEERINFAELAIPYPDHISEQDRERLVDARSLFKSLLSKQLFSFANVEGLFRVEEDLKDEGWTLASTSDESDFEDFEIIDDQMGDNEFIDGTDFTTVTPPEEDLPPITSKDIRNFNDLVFHFFETYYPYSFRFIQTELETYRNSDLPIPPKLIAELALRVEKAKNIETVNDAKALLIKCGYDASRAPAEEFHALATFVLKNIDKMILFRDEAFTDPNFPLDHQQIQAIKDCLRTHEKSQQNPIVKVLDDLFGLSIYTNDDETDLTDLLPKGPRGIITEQPSFLN